MVTLRNRLHVDHTNVDVTLTGDATSGAAVNLVTSSSNGPSFIPNHSNMQIGSSTLPVGKTNPKVRKRRKKMNRNNKSTTTVIK